MADSKISQLTPIAGADLADGDELVVARAATLQNFSVTRAELFQSTPDLDVGGNITVAGTVDGRDVAADGTKLDTIETNADVTDTANVTAAGALMRTGGTMTGDLILNADPAATLQAATKQYVDGLTEPYTAGDGISLTARVFSVAAGTGLTQEAGGLAHADTSSQTSVDNSGNTFIQDITLDEFGHVTAIGSGTAVIGDGTITVSAGTGLTGGGSFTTNQAGNATITVGLSSPVSVANGGTGATDAAGARTNLDVDQAGTALALAIALG